MGIDIEFLVTLLKHNTDNVSRRGRFEGADSNMKVLSYLSDKDMVFPII